MAKVGRNDPCPCGSGKKYKKCCLPSQQSLPKPAATTAREIPDFDVVLEEDDDLDEMSNGVVAAIKAGRLDEAERLCQQLADKYPDLIDPIERYGMLYEARGDYPQAADHYRRAADYARTHEGFDPELVEIFLADAVRVEALAQQHPRRAGTRPPPPSRDDGQSSPDLDESH
jgi:tetratricopeptide (TPR) repeat protein